MPLSPLLQSSRHLRTWCLRRARLQAHERVGEIVVDVVVSAAGSSSSPACLPGRRAWRRRSPGACGAGSGPCCRRTSNTRASGCTCLNIASPISCAPASATASRSKNSLAFELAEAQPFVPHAAFVRGFGGAGEPAFVDAAAMCAVGVPIVGVQLDPLAGMQKRPRHPRGRQPQQPLAGIECALQNRANVVLLNEVRRLLIDRLHQLNWSG